MIGEHSCWTFCRKRSGRIGRRLGIVRSCEYLTVVCALASPTMRRISTYRVSARTIVQYVRMYVHHILLRRRSLFFFQRRSSGYLCTVPFIVLNIVMLNTRFPCRKTEDWSGKQLCAIEYLLKSEKKKKKYLGTFPLLCISRTCHKWKWIQSAC